MTHQAESGISGNRSRRLISRSVLGALLIGVVVAAGFSYSDHARIRTGALGLLTNSKGPAAPLIPGGPEVSGPVAGSGSSGPEGGPTSAPDGGSVASSGGLGSPPGQISLPDASPGAPLPAPSSTASNDGSPGGGSGSTPTGQAVDIPLLSPFLSVSQFGASVGFLLVCNTGAGALSAATAQVPGLSAVMDPVISQVSPLCEKLSSAAVSGLAQLNDQLRVLQGITPATAPFFAQMNQVYAVLDQLATEIRPLSGTLTAIGPLVNFFAGQAS